MDPKKYLTNKHFCPIPWTGFQYNSNGDVLNCIRSQRPIGNLKDKSIHDILSNNTETKQNMLLGDPGLGCDVCYDLEQGRKSFDIISDRIFYLKELKDVPMDTYDSVDQFDLRKIDIRWSNVCNSACVYCGPEYSSKWASELKIKIEEPPKERVEQLQRYVFGSIPKLKHVYLAGGEPLLMKENELLLTELLERNPNVNIRVNTNLSKTGTRVFDLLTKFSNVHWTISLETVEQEYEYIRYGSKWQDFLDNLEHIRELDHKISFNMLHFFLNPLSVFGTVDFLQKIGFHNNSFIIGPMLNPEHLNIRHLPDNILDLVKSELVKRINQKPGFLLENSYENMLQYVMTSIEKKTNYCLEEISKIDQRRNLDSKRVFTNLYNLLERQ